MASLPPAIQELTGIKGDEPEIAAEVVAVLIKLYEGGVPSAEEEQILVNPVESGAILSILSRRPISHRYVKERSRPHIRDHRSVRHRGLVPAKRAGKTNLYRLGDVYRLGPIRQRQNPKKKSTAANIP